MDDQIIIKRVLSGDIDAYAQLVHKHHRNLLAFIYRLVKDADLAEDIGQEVFLNVYKELPRFDPGRGTPFAAWLYIVARNQCISELRRMGRTEFVSEDHLQRIADKGETAESALIRQEELEALRATLEEIAQKCGVAQATVKTRLFRAREKLTLLLKGHFGGASHERKI